jgi:hypothetical protein
VAAQGTAVPENHRILRAGQAVGARHPALQGVVARLREEGVRLRKVERHPEVAAGAIKLFFSALKRCLRRHDTQHNDTQHNSK